MTVCAVCHAENPDGFRFCGNCGSPLTGAAAPQREARRVVTVLFCDVSGSTPLGERLDPESLRAVMGRYLRSSSRGEANSRKPNGSRARPSSCSRTAISST